MTSPTMSNDIAALIERLREMLTIYLPANVDIETAKSVRRAFVERAEAAAALTRVCELLASINVFWIEDDDRIHLSIGRHELGAYPLHSERASWLLSFAARQRVILSSSPAPPSALPPKDGGEK